MLNLFGLGGLKYERNIFICYFVFSFRLCNKIFYRKFRGISKMLDWIIKQITDFNLVTFIAIVFFTTTLSKANATKLLKEQSQELYNEIEELKDEIRGNTRRQS
jgi:hypothetical protein